MPSIRCCAAVIIMIEDEQSIVRFEIEGHAHWGVLSSDGERLFEIFGDVYDEWSTGSELGPVEKFKLIPPCDPKTIAALAYNYKDLVGEKDHYEEPLTFLKASTCLVSATDDIVIPSHIEKVWAEVEIGVVVRKPLFLPSRLEAEDAILGCLVANDITAKNISGRDHHLARSKSFHSFCPVSSVLKNLEKGKARKMQTTVNGRLTQNGNASNRILDEVDALLLVASIFPLEQGDLVLTGTPAGAMDSIFEPGDNVMLSVEGIGTLNNKIVVRN